MNRYIMLVLLLQAGQSVYAGMSLSAEDRREAAAWRRERSMPRRKSIRHSAEWRTSAKVYRFDPELAAVAMPRGQVNMPTQKKSTLLRRGKRNKPSQRVRKLAQKLASRQELTHQEIKDVIKLRVGAGSLRSRRVKKHEAYRLRRLKKRLA